MPRIRFGLRLLLAVPACIAAFYGGWNAHDSRVRALHERAAADSEERRAAMWETIRIERQTHAAALRDSVDRIEHDQRVKAFERMLRDPVEAKMFPSGEF